MPEYPMSPDEMEAKSIRYGNSGLLIVPLSSGKWAIYDRWGTELQGYVELPSEIGAELLEISAKSIELYKKVEKPPGIVSPIAQISATTSLSADELGL